MLLLAAQERHESSLVGTTVPISSKAMQISERHELKEGDQRIFSIKLFVHP